MSAEPKDPAIGFGINWALMGYDEDPETLRKGYVQQVQIEAQKLAYAKRFESDVEAEVQHILDSEGKP